jgi:hypothetical protein
MAELYALLLRKWPRPQIATMVKALDVLVEDARTRTMAHHPALLAMERERALLLDEWKETTP